MSLEDQLRKYILASGMSIRALAKASGTHHPNLYQFMSGQRGLSLETAAKLAGVLGLHLAGSDDNASSLRTGSNGRAGRSGRSRRATR